MNGVLMCSPFFVFNFVCLRLEETLHLPRSLTHSTAVLYSSVFASLPN